MKKLLLILTLAVMVCMTTFMGGCGNRGKIGNGENGTVTDNTNPTATTTQQTTQSTETTTNNNTNNATENTTNDTTNDNTLFGNNTDGNNNQATENASQQGIAGEIGDTIDEGVSDITGDIMGTDANNR